MTPDVQIQCRNIWKVFGADAEGFMRRHNGAPTSEALAEEGYIGAVRDVSFDVTAGEILIIMGLSGSGKSTVIRCITRLNDPTTGEIDFEGEDILADGREGTDRHTPPQDGHGVPEFRLVAASRCDVECRLPARSAGHRPRNPRGQRREMIELVGLGGRESYFPRELSGGQQQRVGIARSLAVEPDVWFLDEPFSALDPLIRAEMQDEFIRLQTDAEEDHRFHHP